MYLSNSALNLNLVIKSCFFMCFRLFILIGLSLLSGVTSAQKILLTSPKGYSERFENVFFKSELSSVAIPMIETVVEDMPDVKYLFDNLNKYEYIAFSSRKAIESFYLEFSKRDIDISGKKFCAVGKDIDYMYEKLAVRPAVYPDEPSPMGIANKLGEDKDIKGKTIAVLVPRVEDIAEPDVVPDFLARLTQIEMNVSRIDAYVTRSVDKLQVKRAIEMISNGEVQCVAFTSSAEIEILLQNIENRDILKNITIACFGPYTAAFARKKGLDVAVVAKDFSSFSGFLAAIEDYYKK